MQRGLTKDALPAGTEIVVIGYQAKDGTLKASGAYFASPDGRKVFLGTSGTGAPYDNDPSLKY